MTLTAWLSLVAVCLLGAMAPGPSVAVVLRHTVLNSRLHGLTTGLAHAAGIGIWAGLSVSGLTLLIQKSPTVYSILTYGGAAYLAWLGIKSLISKGSYLETTSDEHKQVPRLKAAQDGFLIALLNPKIGIFFIALFSQFLTPEQSASEQAILAITAIVIDGGWYSIVALLLSQSYVLQKLKQAGQWIDRMTGVILIGLATRIALQSA